MKGGVGATGSGLAPSSRNGFGDQPTGNIKEIRQIEVADPQYVDSCTARLYGRDIDPRPP
jgi:hypothetical protein